MAIDYCNTDPLGTPTVNYCPADDLVGGASKVILLEEGHGITDPTNNTQIATAISNQMATLIKRVSFWVDAPTPEEQESLVPCETASLVNYGRTGGYINPNVDNNNVDFHNNLFDGRTFAGALFLGCGRDGNYDHVYFLDYPIKFKGGSIFPRGNSEFQRFEGTWSGRSMLNYEVHAVTPGSAWD